MDEREFCEKADTGVQMTEPDHENLERQKYQMNVVDTVKSWKAIRRKKLEGNDAECESVDNC
jgi:hypothetical protein